MPFTLIRGTYHLVGQTPEGRPLGFEPDGDSLHFKPADAQLLNRLEVVGAPCRLSAIGSTQLRLEGVDALELHFGGSHQPRPLADEPRDFLTGHFGLNPVSYEPPAGTRVQPPCEHDGAPGYILSRALEANGRPVAFAFAGGTESADGAEIVLDAEHATESANARLLASGCAYPLFYDTLFAELRSALTEAVAGARRDLAGVWAKDRSMAGMRVMVQQDLEREGVLFPKLFRRITEFLRDGAGDLDAFAGWLREKREQVLVLSDQNFTHLDDVVRVEDSSVRLLRRPEDLVFISAKTSQPGVAPWLRV